MQKLNSFRDSNKVLNWSKKGKVKFNVTVMGFKFKINQIKCYDGTLFFYFYFYK